MNYNITQILEMQDIETLESALAEGVNISALRFLSFLQHTKKFNLGFVELLLNHDVVEDTMKKIFKRAVQTADLETVKLIIEKIDIDFYYGNSNDEFHDPKTALMIASEGGYIEIVKLLLNKGATINLRSMKKQRDNTFPDTALTLGIKNRHVDVVKFLLDMGADINYRNGSPFDIAVTVPNNLEVVKLLVDDYKVNIENTIDDGKETPLMKAIQEGNIDTVRFLLKKGVNVDAISIPYEFTPLMYAIKAGRMNMVNILIREGANLFSKDWSGQTASEMLSNCGLEKKCLEKTWVISEEILNLKLFEKEKFSLMALEIKSIFEILNSDMENKYKYAMLALYKSIELINNLFIEENFEITEKKKYKYAYWKKSDKKIMTLDWDKLKNVEEKGYNLSTEIKIRNILYKLSMQDNTIKKLITQIVCSRNYAIHPEDKRNCEKITVKNVKSKEILTWFEMLKTILFKIDEVL